MSQSSETKYNLTVGGIFSKILVVALPVIGTQLLQMSYNLTDMFWLGRLSTAAVAASGTSGMFMWLTMSLMVMGRMGAEIGVSQNLGRGDRDGARLYGENAFTLAAVLGLISGAALLVWRSPLIGFFNIQEEEVVSQAVGYLSVVSFGMPFNFMTSAMAGCFTASGNSRMPFYVNCVGLGLNMILDPLLIFTFDMGIIGAAAATVASQAASFTLMTIAINRAGQRPFDRFRFFARPDGKALIQIVKWGGPISAESAFFTFMSMLTSRMVSPFGQTALAVGRVGSQIESLSWLIGGGYGSALTAYMGQNYGAGKWTRIHRGFRISMLVMGVWGVIVTVFMCTLGGHAYWVFLPDGEVRAMGIVFLRILAVCQLPQCFEGVAGGAFRGCGKTLPPSVSSVSTNVLRVLLAALFVRIWGAYGVWVAMSLSATLRGFGTLIWYLIDSRKQPAEDAAVQTV